MKTDHHCVVERWGCLELSFPGKMDGNPFADYTIRGMFAGEHETIEADGFYDGDGLYRIRFMPSYPGEYSYTGQMFLAKTNKSFSTARFHGILSMYTGSSGFFD